MRLPKILLNALLALCLLLPAAAALGADEDPYLWLEEVDGEKALAWVTERSAADQAELEAVPEFAPIHEKLQEIFTSNDRIPYPSVQGDYLYNFWQDAEHVRGIWRRTTLASYLSDATEWETVIDVDALAEADGENWVWKGAQGLYPDYDLYLVNLSRGGGDATVVREFDARTKEFVKGGFELAEAKSQIGWRDENAVWVGTDFGEGSLTESGYPRIAKLWLRGTDLAEAKTVFEGKTTDVSAGVYTIHTPDGDYDMAYQTPEFFRGSYFLMRDGKPVALPIPEDADPQGIFKGQFMLKLRTPWRPAADEFPADALLSIDLEKFLAGDRDFEVLFTPEARVSLGRVANTANMLLLSTLDNVASRIYKLTREGGAWQRNEIALPGLGTAGMLGMSDSSDDFFFTYTDFLTPSSLYYVAANEAPVQAKSSPEWFDATGMEVVQYEATAKDGVKIPYFLFTPKGYEANGKNPTLLYGYGGFEVSMRPSYSATVGTSWVERGGVYALANIRGGGEFGPDWHKAAMQENHQTNFSDFIAVAEDLIARKVTSPQKLGIAGGSQGGLLVGGTFVQRPDLFEAVVCQVPLLDMKRFNKLLAGASWMAEYGNPDTDDWDNYMKSWSPYQNVKKDVDYPKVFFFTSTRDDRVHPGHARKMVAKMTDYGHPVYYFENTEGGHAGAANLNQRAYMWALTYAYLWKMLK
ncbi:S9 family peptidase [bacterium]|nr:S9 family peptidase [bacterium]